MAATLALRACAAGLMLTALAIPGRGDAAERETAAGGHEAAGQARTSTVRDATRVVTQPARDIGVAKTKTPPLLIAAGRNPYAMTDTASCRQIAAAIAALSAVLGPDYDAPPPPRQRHTLTRTGGQLARAGGQAVVNSLIPFRGIVREASGAAPAERRREAAISAGIARRGFLRGLQRGRKCRT